MLTSVVINYKHNIKLENESLAIQFSKKYFLLACLQGPEFKFYDEN